MKTLDFKFAWGGPNARLSWKVLPAILEARAVLEATQDPEVKAELPANTEEAAVRGVFGMRTYFIGEKMCFGKVRLGQVEERLCHARRDS